MIYSSYLYGMYGFGLEETGNYHAAEKSAKLVRVNYFCGDNLHNDIFKMFLYGFHGNYNDMYFTKRKENSLTKDHYHDCSAAYYISRD